MATARFAAAAAPLLYIVVAAAFSCGGCAAAGTPAADVLTLLGGNATCKATTDRGVIDLGRLSAAVGRTLFAAADELNSSYYLWSPCVDYDISATSQYKVSSDSLSGCRAFAVAQYFPFTRECELVASHSSSRFYASGDHLVLTYKHEMYNVNISLLCGHDANDSWTRLSNDLYDLAFELRSHELCFDGYGDGIAKPTSDFSQKMMSLLRRLPGYGTLVLFMVAITAVLYVLCGTVYTKLRYKRAVLDSLPNARFWRELPLLVRDGALFVVCRYKKRHNYSKIRHLDSGDGEEDDSSSSEDEYDYSIKPKNSVPHFRAHDSATAAAYSRSRTDAAADGHERVALLHKPNDADDDGARVDPVDV